MNQLVDMDVEPAAVPHDLDRFLPGPGVGDRAADQDHRAGGDQRRLVLDLAGDRDQRVLPGSRGAASRDSWVESTLRSPSANPAPVSASTARAKAVWLAKWPTTSRLRPSVRADTVFEAPQE